MGVQRRKERFRGRVGSKIGILGNRGLWLIKLLEECCAGPRNGGRTRKRKLESPGGIHRRPVEKRPPFNVPQQA